MATYARDDELWEIVLDGAAFHVTADKKTATRKFVSPIHAQQQYEKAIRAQLDLGFVLVPERPEASLDELFGSPNDLEALSVHADALIERGSFLGEVIATQLAIHRLGPDGYSERREKLAAASRRVLAKHHEAIFGVLAPHAVSVIPVSEGEPLGQLAACTASWRFGAIDEVALAASSRIALSETLAALAKVPAARRLRSIVCRSSAPRSARRSAVEYDRFVVVLVENAAAFPLLRSLFLGDLGASRVAARVGDLEPVYAAFPELEVLRIHADEASLGTLSLPNLREIELVGGCATLEALERIRDARLAHLIALTAEQSDSDSSLANALQIVRELPPLERLALRGWYDLAEDSHEERNAKALVALPQLARLQELDLAQNGLFDGIATLITNADRFAHLKKLDLRFNSLNNDPALFAQLRTVLPRANLAGQSPELHPELRRNERYDGIRE